MKLRVDFVTNSSSSAFIISKRFLDEDQIKAIRIHDQLGEKLNLEYPQYKWSIRENKDYISGDTWMDNFDMDEFLTLIDVDPKIVKWSEFSFELNDEDYGSLEHESNEQVKTWRDLLHEI